MLPTGEMQQIGEHGGLVLERGAEGAVELYQADLADDLLLRPRRAVPEQLVPADAGAVRDEVAPGWAEEVTKRLLARISDFEARMERLCDEREGSETS